MPLRDGFFSTATQTSCCNRIQRSNRVRLLVVSTHDFPDNLVQANLLLYRIIMKGAIGILPFIVLRKFPRGLWRIVVNSRPTLFVIDSPGHDFLEEMIEGCVKKNLNASRSSEHPPVKGGKCQNV